MTDYQNVPVLVFNRSRIFVLAPRSLETVTTEPNSVIQHEQFPRLQLVQ